MRWEFHGVGCLQARQWMSPPTRSTCLENRLYHSAYERTMPNDCISKLRAYARVCARARAVCVCVCARARACVRACVRAYVRIFVEICRCGVKFKLLLNHAPNHCYLSEIRSNFVRFVCVLWRTVVTKRPHQGMAWGGYKQHLFPWRNFYETGQEKH